MKKYILFASVFAVSCVSFILFDKSSQEIDSHHLEAWAQASVESYDAQLFAKNSNVKDGRKPAAAGPAFITGLDGRRKLYMTVKFYCSAWLYLDFPSDPNTPEAINARECAKFAGYTTGVVQKIYDNSRIPILFAPIWTVEPSRYTGLLGQSSVSKAQRIQAVNNASFPVLKVVDADITSTTGPAQLSVNTATCSPFASTNCGNPNSTVAVTNFQWRWGVPQPTAKCGSAFCQNYGFPSTSYAFDQRAYTTSSQCIFSCACVHWANDKTTWESPASGCVTGYGLGPWPGHPREIGRNSCGCLVTSTPGVTTWKSGPNAKRPTVTYTTLPDIPLLWLATNGFLPPVGEHTITIGVAPRRFPVVDKPDTYIAGQVYGMTDYVTKATETILKTPYINTSVTPQNYLSQIGVVVVAANGEFPAITVAHELGHIFGAQHAMEDLAGSNWYALNNYKYRSVGAYRHTITEPKYSTIMDAKQLPIPYFSTTYFQSSLQDPLPLTNIYVLGSQAADNRKQIVGTLSYLAGENLEYVSDPRSILNIIKSLILDEP